MGKLKMGELNQSTLLNTCQKKTL